jgi:hypothetical protein
MTRVAIPVSQVDSSSALTHTQTSNVHSRASSRVAPIDSDVSRSPAKMLPSDLQCDSHMKPGEGAQLELAGVDCTSPVLYLDQVCSAANTALC